MARRIQLRRDTAANWTNTDPVLAQGEVGVDLTNNKIKVGNGVDSWNQLDYLASDGTGLATKEYVDNAVGAIEIPDVSEFITAAALPTDINQLADSDSLLFDGDYDSLSNKPDLTIYAESGNLANVALTGSYNDLFDQPALFDGDYDSLSNKPVIPADIGDLTDNGGLLDPVAVSSISNGTTKINIPNENGDIEIDGNVELYGGLDIHNDDITFFRSGIESGRITSQGETGGAIQVQAEVNFEVKVSQDDGQDGVETALWTYGSDGSITFPDDTVQTTAYPGPQTLFTGDVKGSVFADDSSLLVDGVNGIIPGYVSIETLKEIVAASSDFEDFKARIQDL